MRKRQDHRRGERGKGRGRRPRMGRFLAHGDLRFLILKLIEEKPRHGYEIIKAIEEKVSGVYSPSPGAIYPTLTLLEELEWIRAIESDGTKRLFEMTEDGALALKANRATVEAILERMREVSEARSDEAGDDDLAGETDLAPQLRLALEDLKRAIAHRMSGDPLTPDQIAAIVAALSTAATEVERS